MVPRPYVAAASPRRACRLSFLLPPPTAPSRAVGAGSGVGLLIRLRCWPPAQLGKKHTQSRLFEQYASNGVITQAKRLPSLLLAFSFASSSPVLDLSQTSPSLLHLSFARRALAA